MKRDIWIQRMAEAQQRLVAAASALGMNVEFAEHRDPDIRHLRLIETVANELERFEGKADEAVSDHDRIGFVVGDANAEALADAGYDTPEAVRSASDEDLDAVDGVGPATVAKLREAFGEAS